MFLLRNHSMAIYNSFGWMHFYYVPSARMTENKVETDNNAY